MGIGHKHLIWLTPQGPGQGGDALLVSALCGDEIRVPGGAWLWPAGVSRGEGVMLLGYAGAGGGLGFCVVAPLDLSPAWVQGVRADLSLEGAERRWGPFVGHFERYRSVASPAGPAAWLEAAIVHDGATWRARRKRHPSAAIDCLSQRDRVDAEQRLRAVLVRGGGLACGESTVTAQSGGPP